MLHRLTTCIHFHTKTAISGIFGVPLPMCAAMYLKGILEFSECKGQRRVVKEFHIIDIKDDVLDHVQKIHQSISRGKSKMLDPVHVLHKFSEGEMRATGNVNKWNQYGERNRSDKSQDNKNRNRHKCDSFASSLTWKPAVQATKPDYHRSKSFSEGQDVEINAAQFKIGHCDIFIYTGDILALNGVDGLVSSENQSVSGSGRLASSILKAAGEKYKKEHAKLQPPNGKYCRGVLVTTAGELSYQRVFHAITIKLSDKKSPDWKDLDILANLVYAVLQKADELVITWKVWKILRPESIAIPLLGAGNYSLVPALMSFG